MNIELTEEGYTLDGKWKLVPISASKSMIKAFGNNFLYTSYNDMIVASPKPELPRQEYKRSGEVHVGGEILPEFEQSKYLNTKHWCKGCGVDINHLHMPNCPTLKSKL